MNILEEAITLAEEPVITGGLPEEEFLVLSEKVAIFKERILKGETLSVPEASLITVWFRARRAKAFLSAKKAPTRVARKQVRKKKPKVTSNDILDSL